MPTSDNKKSLNSPTLHLKELVKDEQTKPKVSGRKEQRSEQKKRKEIETKKNRKRH